MAEAVNTLPPLPDGFSLDGAGGLPPLPDGFSLDGAPKQAASKIAGQDWPANAGTSVANYFGQHIADAFDAAWTGLKSDWETTASENDKAAATPDFWDRQKHLFNAHVASGKLPFDAFGLAISGVNGLLDAVVTEPLAYGLAAISPVSQEKAHQEVNSALWALAPEKGSLGLRAGIPAATAPSAAALDAGRTVLATMKTGDPAALKGTEHIPTNIAATWAKTGEDPASLVQRAQTDPVLREQLQSEQPKKPPEGSSTTKTDDGDFVIPKIKTKPRNGVLGINRTSWEYPIETDEAGKTGKIAGMVDNKVFRISSSSNPVPGKGFGTKAYAGLADEVLAQGGVLQSDNRVSVGAQRVYEKLKEAGYTVEKNPEAVVDPGKGLRGNFDNGDGWVYRVTAGPNDRPLAERLAAAKKWEANAPVGTLDEAKDAIGLHMVQAPTPAGKFSFGDFTRRVYDELFDDQAPWKRLLAAARDGKPLPEAASNSEFLQKLATGSRGLGRYGLDVAQIDIDGNKIGPSLQDILSEHKTGDDFKELEQYATARRAQDLHARGIETGLNDNAVNKMAGDPAMRAKHEKAFQALVKFQNNDLELLRRSGFLTDEQVAATLAKDPNRVPFQREIETGKVAPAGAGGTVYNPMKNIVGSGRRILGPVEQIMRQHMVRMDLATHNLANDALVTELEAGGFATKTTSQVRPIELTPEEIDRIVEAHGGSNMEDFDATIFRHFKLPIRDDELPIFRDGKMQAYKLADPEAAKILRGMGQPAAATWTKIMRGFASVQRAGIVLNPAFSLRQILYDVPFQHIITPGFRNTAADFLTGLAHGLGKTEAADEFMRSGAWRPIFDQVNDQYIRSQIATKYGEVDFFGGVRNAITSPLRALRAWADMIYSAQRRGRFIRERAAGATREEAASQAQLATFHTGEKGSWARQVNQVQPFFSAYLNTIKRTAEAFKNNPVKTFGKAAALLTTPMVMNYLAYKDEDWYKEAPAYKKDMGLILPPSSPDADPYFIPLVPGLSIPFVALPRRLLEAFDHHDPHAFDGFLKDAAHELLPWQATYNMMLPIVENIANYSFFKGHALFSPSQKVGTAEQYTPYTSEVAKELSKTVDDIPLLRDFNMAPWQIDNLVQGWFGTLGQKALQVADKLIPTKNEAPETKLSDNAWFGSFAVRYPSAQAQSVMTYESRYSQFEAEHGSLETAFRNSDLSRFQELAARTPAVADERMKPRVRPQDLPSYLRALQENRQTGLVPALNQLRKVERSMQMDRDLEHKIRNDDTLSGHDKRQLLDQIYGQMVMFSRNGNDVLDALGVK